MSRRLTPGETLGCLRRHQGAWRPVDPAPYRLRLRRENEADPETLSDSKARSIRPDAAQAAGSPELAEFGGGS